MLRDLPPKFLQRFTVAPSGCWLWQGAIVHGYGKFYEAGKLRAAHRYSYTALRGEIPDGLQLDHLCRVRNCVNPDHLEPVTAQENTRRAWAVTAPARCGKGHVFDDVNTYRDPTTGHRQCRECRRIRMKANRNYR